MRALIIRHHQPSDAGYVGERLVQRGFELVDMLLVPDADFARPHVTVAFPDPRAYDLIVPLGALWSVYDHAAIGTWIGDELAFLRAAVEADVPVLGICFGAQALAAALGGSVERAARPEIGWTDVQSDDPDLVGEGPWFQWHFDRIVVPPAAKELARTALAPQAYVVGRSLGLQFHPEVTPAGVQAWLDIGGAAEVAKHGYVPEELVRPKAGARERTHALVDNFLDRIARI
ncbi:type 1 glutamine amidotransferase [Yinghuangia soli]|uniref:Gamma-glutamyl-gamma-aminobutyrate hydrolase family protein n=1 Tax=Yinghuangia soli TaxID=2908204 RepID=A0AA41Q2Y5_9ACTN|nr:gamma-glutamyl-gamma-aminobutyrate hydrolase family protein [Yinghuangia soli]MCF2530351.1 gamma-glutamyl-gamma-aminobutyrate hydrolase family protein [Yinghuangia soli]